MLTSAIQDADIDTQEIPNFVPSQNCLTSFARAIHICCAGTRTSVLHRFKTNRLFESLDWRIWQELLCNVSMVSAKTSLLPIALQKSFAVALCSRCIQLKAPGVETTNTENALHLALATSCHPTVHVTVNDELQQATTLARIRGINVAGFSTDC